MLWSRLPQHARSMLTRWLLSALRSVIAGSADIGLPSKVGSWAAARGLPLIGRITRLVRLDPIHQLLRELDPLEGPATRTRIVEMLRIVAAELRDHPMCILKMAHQCSKPELCDTAAGTERVLAVSAPLLR